MIRICRHPDRIETAGQRCQWPMAVMPMTWTILDELPGIPEATYQLLCQRAMDAWCSVCGATHKYTETGRLANILATARRIDGAGSILGETELPCGQQQVRMWLDVGEQWQTMDPGERGIFAQAVVAHELGHAFGLQHGPTGCLMAPYYDPQISTPRAWDIEQMRLRYGPRLAPVPPTPKPSPAPKGNPMGKSDLLAMVLKALHVVQFAVKFTPTEADDKIVEGLIELVELFQNGKVTPEQFQAALADLKAVA